MDCREEVIIKELKDIKDLLKKQVELLEKLHFVFEKYDEEFQQSPEYIEALKADGFHPPKG